MLLRHCLKKWLIKNNNTTNNKINNESYGRNNKNDKNNIENHYIFHTIAGIENDAKSSVD